jgi:hypothetical protein
MAITGINRYVHLTAADIEELGRELAANHLPRRYSRSPAGPPGLLTKWRYTRRPPDILQEPSGISRRDTYRRSNYGAAQHDSGATGNPPYSCRIRRDVPARHRWFDAPRGAPRVA